MMTLAISTAALVSACGVGDRPIVVNTSSVNPQAIKFVEIEAERQTEGLAAGGNAILQLQDGCLVAYFSPESPPILVAWPSWGYPTSSADEFTFSGYVYAVGDQVSLGGGAWSIESFRELFGGQISRGPAVCLSLADEIFVPWLIDPVGD